MWALDICPCPQHLGEAGSHWSCSWKMQMPGPRPSLWTSWVVPMLNQSDPSPRGVPDVGTHRPPPIWEPSGKSHPPKSFLIKWIQWTGGYRCEPATTRQTHSPKTVNTHILENKHMSIKKAQQCPGRKGTASFPSDRFTSPSTSSSSDGGSSKRDHSDSRSTDSLLSHWVDSSSSLSPTTPLLSSSLFHMR